MPTKMDSKAWALIGDYLFQNYRTITLDEDAKKILEADIDKGEYFLYDPEEIATILRKNNIVFNPVPEQIRDILSYNLSACYFPLLTPYKGRNYAILIRKEVPKLFIICQFIHEYGHFQFRQGLWKDKKLLPVVEESKCQLLSKKYALRKGFMSQYLSQMQAIFGTNPDLETR